MRYICPRCGGDGYPSPVRYIYGWNNNFPSFEIRGVFNKKYFLSCNCPTCAKVNLFKAHFDVEFTKAQALDYERKYKEDHTTPIGRIEE